jgi:hypothetical protein
MDTTNPDRFAYETFMLAFRIQKILKSDLIPREIKEGLAADCVRLKEKVDLLTRYREDQESFQGPATTPLGPFFKPF